MDCDFSHNAFNLHLAILPQKNFMQILSSYALHFSSLSNLLSTRHLFIDTSNIDFKKLDGEFQEKWNYIPREMELHTTEKQNF